MLFSDLLGQSDSFEIHRISVVSRKGKKKSRSIGINVGVEGFEPPTLCL